ncbi:hypothetical protein HDU78_007541 [Chytriomyces hyalinus]|nr:hypothetical protein HDU78_007541 [Chytriomyces hyalinus]
MPTTDATTNEPSIVALPELEAGSPSTLFPDIERAFGLGGLGLIVVRMPAAHEYHTLRRSLLAMAAPLAAMPEEDKLRLEHPDSQYSFGWSHGKEMFDGVPDTLKGSFYAQVYERDHYDEDYQKRFPFYAHKNIWPSPESFQGHDLEAAFIALGKTMTEVGVLLARRIDEFLKTKHGNLSSLEAALSSPLNCHKGRLLYYFPKEESAASSDGKEASWCGLHLDHSLLTGLTRAIFNPATLPTGDTSGLYIQLPNKEMCKVAIPEDCIAFQVGEAAQILSRGVLRATPHLVKGTDAVGIDRSTFACFLQPEVDFNLGDGLTFGKFTENILASHYEGGPVIDEKNGCEFVGLPSVIRGVLISQYFSKMEALVRQATDEKQTRENWALFIRICDNANVSSDKAREAVSALSKRIVHSNANVSLFALTLANSLVQTCSIKVHREISSRVFVDAITRHLMSSGVHMTVKLRILEMLQSWAIAFKDKPELGYLVDAYNQLKRQGLNFPDPDAKPESAKKSASQLAKEQEDDEIELALALSMSADEQKKHSRNSAPPPPAQTPTARNPICRVRALYDFPGLEEGELRLAFNDIVNVHDDTTFKEWWKGECGGRVGIFPSNYVERIEGNAASAATNGGSTGDDVQDVQKVERFVGLLANLRPGESLSENARVQELYHAILVMRPKLLADLESARSKQDELVQLNDRFTNACSTYHKLMDASLAAQRAAYQQQPQYSQQYGGYPQQAPAAGYAVGPQSYPQPPQQYGGPPPPGPQYQQNFAAPPQNGGYYQQ